MDEDDHVLGMKAFGPTNKTHFIDEGTAFLIADKIYFLGRQFSPSQQFVYQFDTPKEILTAREIKINPVDDSKIDWQLLRITLNGELMVNGRLTGRTIVVDFIGRIDRSNKLKWANAFSWLQPTSILTEPDGGMLVGAGLDSSALILKLNFQGEIIWGKWYGVKTTGGSWTNKPLSIARSRENTLLVLSQSNLFAVLEKYGDSLRNWTDMLLMHLDNSGTGSIFLWNFDPLSGFKGSINLNIDGSDYLLSSQSCNHLYVAPFQVKIEPIKTNLTSWGKTKYSW
ncbi:MAG: hypothetical protein N3B16_12590 [Candidatus Aminicenantes bacterium]|nr:hypothetical protein [Candidatus Aminicenantes bacterium]